MAGVKAIISDKNISISVVRRALMPPTPGTAGPRHEYSTVFTVKAGAKTMSGTSEWSQVEIDGTKVSHVFTIRHTSLVFDVRDRVLDADGTLYQILKIEKVDLGNRMIKIYTARIGDNTIAANQ